MAQREVVPPLCYDYIIPPVPLQWDIRFKPIALLCLLPIAQNLAIILLPELGIRSEERGIKVYEPAVLISNF